VTDVVSIDPRTGHAVEVVAPETTPEEVRRLCDQAAAAVPALAAIGRAGRAGLLRRLADALDARREEIVAVADRETALGATRLGGELTRTCYQLRLFAEVLDEGSYVEATIDHPGDTPMGPRPDLRRMLVPLGPVAVFGASNFPLAFSVPGGDTASALAAGCPVVVKAHGSHPRTSQLCFEVMSEALRRHAAPEGTLALVHGVQAGVVLVAHPGIRAVGFTGSSTGGQALVEIINRRPDPIPFYGELSSLNPVIVTPTAAGERAAELGAGLVGSYTMGAGQFCTKPGLIFVPSGADGDQVVDTMAAAIAASAPQVLLNERIAASYREATSRLAAEPGVETISSGPAASGEGFEAVPLLLATTAKGMPAAVTEECFGPVSVVVRYDSEDDLQGVLATLPASLTTTLQVGADDAELPAAVSAALESRTGRFVYNSYPTGVAVSWAQHHGGSWPSTNTAHTSVGTTAVRRFLRPVAWQGAPESVLPEELRDADPGIPRRIDGVLVLPGH
jgi:NADP-dependent aldehyde dehydrogenase